MDGKEDRTTQMNLEQSHRSRPQHLSDGKVDRTLPYLHDERRKSLIKIQRR